MKDNVKLAIFVMVLLVLTFSYLLFRFFKEEEKQKVIVAARNRIEDLKIIGRSKNFREIEQLNMSKGNLPQENEGDDPCNENFPSIRMHSYGEKSDFVFASERIWWFE